MSSCHQQIQPTVAPASNKQKPPSMLNENHINISLSDRESCLTAGVDNIHQNTQAISGSNSQAISIQPNPINLNVRTETDWPTIAVGFSSVITALFIAYFSHRTQKNQVRANIANIRAKWLEDLREFSSRFIELMSLALNKSRDENNWLQTQEGTENYSSLVYVQTKISLMLDKSKDKNKSVILTTEEILSLLKHDNVDVREAEVTEKATKFEEEISELLEKAWADIKFDLNPTIFERFTRALRVEIKKTAL